MCVFNTPINAVTLFLTGIKSHISQKNSSINKNTYFKNYFEINTVKQINVM